CALSGVGLVGSASIPASSVARGHVPPRSRTRDLFPHSYSSNLNLPPRHQATSVLRADGAGRDVNDGSTEVARGARDAARCPESCFVGSAAFPASSVARGHVPPSSRTRDLFPHSYSSNLNLP